MKGKFQSVLPDPSVSTMLQKKRKTIKISFFYNIKFLNVLHYHTHIEASSTRAYQTTQSTKDCPHNWTMRTRDIQEYFTGNKDVQIHYLDTFFGRQVFFYISFLLSPTTIASFVILP